MRVIRSDKYGVIMERIPNCGHAQNATCSQQNWRIRCWNKEIDGYTCKYKQDGSLVGEGWGDGCDYIWERRSDNES